MIDVMYFNYFHLNINYNVIVASNYPLHDVANKIIFGICI